MKSSSTVSALFHHKGSDIWSVSPETTVFEAIKLMADKNIGALLVMSGGKLVGVFTERDYTRKVALAGKIFQGNAGAGDHFQPRSFRQAASTPSRNACGS